jgi:hypothetical protein
MFVMQPFQDSGFYSYNLEGPTGGYYLLNDSFRVDANPSTGYEEWANLYLSMPGLAYKITVDKPESSTYRFKIYKNSEECDTIRKIAENWFSGIPVASSACGIKFYFNWVLAGTSADIKLYYFEISEEVIKNSVDSKFAEAASKIEKLKKELEPSKKAFRLIEINNPNDFILAGVSYGSKTTSTWWHIGKEGMRSDVDDPQQKAIVITRDKKIVYVIYRPSTWGRYLYVYKPKEETDITAVKDWDVLKNLMETKMEEIRDHKVEKEGTGFWGTILKYGGIGAGIGGVTGAVGGVWTVAALAGLWEAIPVAFVGGTVGAVVGVPVATYYYYSKTFNYSFDNGKLFISWDREASLVWTKSDMMLRAIAVMDVAEAEKPKVEPKCKTIFECLKKLAEKFFGDVFHP